MRIAPLAFFGDGGDPSFSRLVRDVASITHRNDEAIAGALALVSGTQRLAARHSRKEVLTALVEELPDTALSDSLAALLALPDGAAALDPASLTGTSGRTAQSVALALFHRLLTVDDRRRHPRRDPLRRRRRYDRLSRCSAAGRRRRRASARMAG